MQWIFEGGFLGTRAPVFMDIVTLIVSLLPLLLVIAISFARDKKYKAHKISQLIIFITSVIVVSFFEYGVRASGGFNSFMQESSVSHNYAFIVLIVHIIIATITLFIWGRTIFMSKNSFNATNHKRAGQIAFLGVVATSFSGIWVYLLMFVY